MGMDLYGKGGYFRFSNSGWADVYQLAIEFSWQPSGTSPSLNGIRSYRYALRRDGSSDLKVQQAIQSYRAQYDGGYHSNDGQVVSARDAKQLAESLSTALAAVTTLFTVRGLRTKTRCDFTRKLLNELKSYSDPDNRKMLAEFISFCEAGRFAIH